MVSPETLTLYHSTDKRGIMHIQESGCLFGRDGLGNENSGANLTTDQKASQNFIISFKGQGQWPLDQGAPELYMLTFELPKEFTKLVRITPIFDCPEYATTLNVEARHIPEAYLSYLHAGNGSARMSLEKAIQLESQGKIRFYQVPLEDYLLCIEPISFAYKGVTYPLIK